MSATSCAGVILAAGKGTRMRSETPKVLHPILGRPMVVHVLDALIAAGADPVVLVIGHGAPRVRAATGSRDGRVRFVEQTEQLGTGHAAAQARRGLQGFSGDILLLPGDVPLVRPDTLRNLLDYHRRTRAPVTVLTMRLENPAHYGRIVRDREGALDRIVEARDAGADVLAIQEINSGIYAVDADFLFSALQRLTPDNAQAEYYLTDIVAVARAQQLTPRAWLHDDPEELAGVNDRAELAQADARLRARINRRWMKQGVTLVDPASTRVELDVMLSPDTTLEPGVQLRGACRVERDVRLETGVIAEDTIIGAGATVGAYSVLRQCRVDPGRALPPFTSITPETRNGSHG